LNLGDGNGDEEGDRDGGEWRKMDRLSVVV
jgi:hypothetical protein